MFFRLFYWHLVWNPLDVGHSALLEMAREIAINGLCVCVCVSSEAVALPAAQADGKEGQGELFKETNKVFDIGKGAIEMEVSSGCLDFLDRDPKLSCTV